MRRHPVFERQEPPQPVQLAPAPERNLDKIIRPRHHPGEHDQQDFIERIKRLPALAGVLKGGKVVKQVGRGHGDLRSCVRISENHISTPTGIPYAFERLP